MTFVRLTLPILLALGALALPGAPLAVADSGTVPANHCLQSLDSLDALPAEPQASLLNLAVRSSHASLFEARCSDHGLAELIVEIQPGQLIEAVLQLSPPANATVIVEIASAQDSGEAVDWLHLEPAVEDESNGQAIGLTLSARDLRAANEQFEQRIRITLDAGDDSLSFEVPVRMIVQEEAPLFRNRFEVDPVLGQFSYLAPDRNRGVESTRAATLVMAALSD